MFAQPLFLEKCNFLFQCKGAVIQRGNEIVVGSFLKALPCNPRMAHLLASFPSYFTKILVSSSTTACEFLYCLTKNPTAQLHHRNCAVMPQITDNYVLPIADVHFPNPPQSDGREVMNRECPLETSHRGRD